MTKLLLVIGAGIFLVSCNSATPKVENVTASKIDTPSNQSTTAIDSNVVVDPVCKMKQGEEKFTDYSIYKKDTVWFCSPHCKKMFDKAPEKYVTKK